MAKLNNPEAKWACAILAFILVIGTALAQYTPPSGGGSSTLGGDVTGPSSANTVVKVNGNVPGGTCAIQFVRSIDSSGRPICQPIVNADLASATTAGLAENTNLYYTDARVVTELGTLNATSQTGRCTGTGYTLTATLAQVACGTTQPTVTLGSAGTYLLLFNARIDLFAATFAANRIAIISLERSNNTPVALFQIALNTGTVMTVTQTAYGGNLSGFATYTTANNNDAITLFANVNVVPTAGSAQVTDGDVLALRIF